jgi:hypothetical protein
LVGVEARTLEISILAKGRQTKNELHIVLRGNSPSDFGLVKTKSWLG